MIQWDRNKHEINNGFEFNPGDDATVEQINGTINNALYSVDFADGLTETPEVENPNPEASPTVSFVDYVKEIEGVQKTLKKFKFTNIKGQRGEKGEKGDKGDSAVSFRVGSVVTLPAGSGATATNIGTNQDVVLDLGIPKGDKGDTPVLEFDSKPTENSSKLVNSGVLYKEFETINKTIREDVLRYRSTNTKFTRLNIAANNEVEINIEELLNNPILPSLCMMQAYFKVGADIGNLKTYNCGLFMLPDSGTTLYFPEYLEDGKYYHLEIRRDYDFKYYASINSRVSKVEGTLFIIPIRNGSSFDDVKY